MLRISHTENQQPVFPAKLSIEEGRAALSKILKDPDYDAQDRIRELNYLIPKLPHETFADAIEVAYESGGPWLVQALELLAEAISERDDTKVFVKLLNRADRLSREEFYRLLPKLYRGLAAVMGEAALSEVHRAISDTASWFP
jgi:hypothetical protein